ARPALTAPGGSSARGDGKTQHAENGSGRVERCIAPPAGGPCRPVAKRCCRGLPYSTAAAAHLPCSAGGSPLPALPTPSHSRVLTLAEPLPIVLLHWGLRTMVHAQNQGQGSVRGI